ncbi:type II toxin-antitoxin system RelE/ParE family toxin [Pannonibacter sp. SL95]|uniref:type II toxin-antitoxin system RelE/ParE family toxin n=1 Tax=Pannonibacter sp. SL95 TaxID=2995153 RepID=UPI003FA39660
MNPVWVLSEVAAQDLEDILVFGIVKFGEHQALAYQLSLEQCFDRIASLPRLGRICPVAPNLRQIRHQSHIVFYLPSLPELRIVRVLHAAVMPATLLSKKS